MFQDSRCFQSNVAFGHFSAINRLPGWLIPSKTINVSLNWMHQYQTSAWDWFCSIQWFIWPDLGSLLIVKIRITVLPSTHKYMQQDVTSQAENGTFTVKNLEAADKGLYFCAVSEHNDADVSGSWTETILSSDAYRHAHFCEPTHTNFKEFLRKQSCFFYTDEISGTHDDYCLLGNPKYYPGLR